MGGGMMLMLSCRMQGKNLWANRVAHRFMGGKIRPYTPIGWEIRLFSPQNQAILWAEQFAHSHPSAKNLAMGEWAGGIYPAHSPIQIGPAHSDNQSTSKASAKCRPDCHPDFHKMPECPRADIAQVVQAEEQWQWSNPTPIGGTFPLTTPMGNGRRKT